MKQIDFNTWEELEKEIQNLYELLAQYQHDNLSTVSRPLFRGQESASRRLETTLERYKDGNISVDKYNRYLWCIKPAVESYTGRKWDMTRDFILNDERFFDGPPNYEFMAYVRHHGFPSPLLDWSQSHYIALFFAFRNALPDDRVAIYAYVESVGHGKGGWVGAPQICELGPYISTHKRHFTQQGQYTVCVKKDEDEWVYSNHEEFFTTSTDEEQDLLFKYTLPGGIKNQVLTKLDSMNVNSFTLFGSEDSLMEMLAFREILKKRF